MRVLVCGGRDFRRFNWLCHVLDVVKPSVIIEGGAKGADRYAGIWADTVGVSRLTFEADWSQGPSAGPIRNARMLREGKPDLVIAFPGGTGTKDMVKRSIDAGVKVLDLRELHLLNWRPSWEKIC